jgi:phosphonate degradation associated HDIG domain protein
MNRLSSLPALEQLYVARGGLKYGEDVTQMEHALQCAVLARAQGAAPGLVAAALLHDVGHLLETDEDMAARGIDDAHEISGAQALRRLFDETVRGPIALHVKAKRYLCWREADYFAALSPASRMSLALQGGAFDAEQAAAFEQLPFWREAVALRRFDDNGKSQDISGCGFAEFIPLLQSQLTR